MNNIENSNSGAVLAFAGDLVPSNISTAELLAALQSVKVVIDGYGCHDFIANLESSLLSQKISSVDTGSSVVCGALNIFCDSVRESGLNLTCSLANNHMADFGPAAIKDTISALTEINVATLGAGKDPLSARHHHIIQNNGVRVGLLAFCSTRKCVGTHLKSEIGSPISLIDENMQTYIKKLALIVDHVVVICHWGRDLSTIRFLKIEISLRV